MNRKKSSKETTNNNGSDTKTHDTNPSSLEIGLEYGKEANLFLEN